MAVTTPDKLQAWLIWLHDTSGLTDRDIAAKPLFSGVPAGTINTIRKHGRVPKKWRRKLHVLCQHCGRLEHTYECTREKPVPLVAEVYNPDTHELKKIAPHGAPQPRAPRIAVHKEKAKSAAKSLWNNIEPQVLDEILEEIELYKTNKSSYIAERR